MDEILRLLKSRSHVLDLGSGSGSFQCSRPDITVVRADLGKPSNPPVRFVICSANSLPFRDKFFEAVVCNHSMEHFEKLQDCVAEIARTLAPSGFLYISVPDASTLTDKLYRWLARGGGHVNAFTDVHKVPDLIASASGLRLAGARVLFTSLSFLNRGNIVSKRPRKALLLGNGNETVLKLGTLVLRYLDRCFGWRTSVYGWAYYFGDVPDVDCSTWSNVCVRCGSGHPSLLLEQTNRVTHRRLWFSTYECPRCGTRNYFTADG